MLNVMIATTLAIILVVAIHHEVLTHLSKGHFQRQWPPRVLLPVGVLIVIVTHVVEIWIFGLAYLVLFKMDGVGSVEGVFNADFLDCIYFSFVNYTSLGYGDLVPTGYIRYMAGSEALVGLVLIAWSASFTYLQMQRIVEDREG